ATGNPSDGDFPYLVQLPAEYDPYRRYPTLLVLNDSDHTPEQALDFWAGSIPPPSADGVAAPRRGQAMRHGYITIAPLWQKPHQGGYEFTGREHVAVLTVLRDASRRFSIDADRVYLTGHGAGGDAAWDLAQAHPDLWAGVLPFVAVSDKYIAHYWDNVRHVPLYFVAGELDGRTMSLNAPVWDLYLRKPPSGAKPGFDVTIVEFQGRGHEPFHDEILNAFDWMGRKTRGTSPKEFACNTLRPFDSFFWWLECGQLPEQFMIHPTEWNSRRARPARVEGKMLEDNRLWARSPAPQTTVWLNPDVVDFDKPVRLTFNGTKASLGDGIIRPDPVVLLEDVRTRGDRQRPFWARIDMP
ncbi:MAG TPA: peptidase, partial [Lacipirellulaceae bacterium]|nr:peptidase [Lacipirellulaceae bacterium]